MPRWPDLHRFWQAAESNARELIDDAEILLKRERWPRAYALAVLAYEEFGKGLMALALAAAHPSLVTSARLRELKDGHIRKLMSAYEHEAMIGKHSAHSRMVIGSVGLAGITGRMPA